MKIPVCIPSLILALAFVPAGRAQNETTRDLLSFPALRLPAANVLPNAGDPVGSPSHSMLRPSPWTAKMVRLAQSGIEESVLLAFIDNSGAFNLGADQIIYLNELGVSGEVVSAMLQHDREMISAPPQSNLTSNPAAPAAAGAASITDSSAATNASTPPATPPAPSATVGAEPAEGANGTFWIGTNSFYRAAQFASTQTLEQVSPPLSSQSQPAPVKRRVFYPVREPYPVELTAPIVFLYPPNFQ